MRTMVSYKQWNFVAFVIARITTVTLSRLEALHLFVKFAPIETPPFVCYHIMNDDRIDNTFVFDVLDIRRRTVNTIKNICSNAIQMKFIFHLLTYYFFQFVWHLHNQ